MHSHVSSLFRAHFPSLMLQVQPKPWQRTKAELHTQACSSSYIFASLGLPIYITARPSQPSPICAKLKCRVQRFQSNTIIPPRRSQKQPQQSFLDFSKHLERRRIDVSGDVLVVSPVNYVVRPSLRVKATSSSLQNRRCEKRCSDRGQLGVEFL